MVAMVIGLLVTIVIYQVFANFEGQKRTTTGGGIRSKMGCSRCIRSNARRAWPVTASITSPCSVATVVAADVGPPARNFNFTMAPVQITDGASGSPDSVTVVYGNSNALTASVRLLQAAASVDTFFVIDNAFGFAAGDAIIAGEVGKSCSLATVSGVAGSNVNHDVGNYTDANGATQAARYNKSGGLGVAYGVWNVVTQSGGRLFDLGLAPAVVTYSVQNSQLVVQNLLTSGNPSAAVDGIVQLQAQYGRDTNGDGAVDSWSPPAPPAAPATSADWAAVSGVRLAVVARNQQAERPSAQTGVCNTTTSAPTWAGGAIDLTADPNWQCYRYRVFETIVPVRNQIWVPQ